MPLNMVNNSAVTAMILLLLLLTEKWYLSIIWMCRWQVWWPDPALNLHSGEGGVTSSLPS